MLGRFDELVQPTVVLSLV